jgi:UDP-glucose 4-epimerase
MRISVTGGSGFIGQHVVSKLARDHEVINIDVNAPAPHYASTTWFGSIDIFDSNALGNAIKDADVVVHLAAMADVDYAIRFPAETVRSNVVGTQSVLDAIRAKSTSTLLIHASTVWVYGDSPAVHDENSALPLAGHIYTASKIAAESLVSAYVHSYGLDAVILRFGIPFGNHGRRSGLIPSVVSRAKAGMPLVISGTGKQTRQFVPVSDIAMAIEQVLACKRRSRIYNLAYENPVSALEVAGLARDLTGNRSPIEFTPGRQNDLMGNVVSTRLARDELGWKPALDFKDSLAKYIEEF